MYTHTWGLYRHLFLSRTFRSSTSNERTANFLGQREGDEFTGKLAARNRDQYVLFAVDHVGHRRVVDARRQLHLPDDCSVLLVEGAEHLPAEPLWHADGGVAALAHEHQA